MSSEWYNIAFWEYEFLAPYRLLGLLIVPLLIWLFYSWDKSRKGAIKSSRKSADLRTIEFPLIRFIVGGMYVFLAIGLSFLIMAVAKPFYPYSEGQEEDYGEGIDIVISLDISGSMMATDFLPNRLEAAKEVAKEFVDARPKDRIGLVVYEGEAYTACPATRDHEFLKKAIGNIQSGWLEPGTAIGTGLGTAVARLRDDEIKSKVVILLSDGENNKGEIAPMEAAELAQNKGVRVYTIGVGKEGYASMPVNTPFGTIMQNTKVSIDEKLLTNIAELTGGKYFRAQDKASLRDIYKKIDQMETMMMVEAQVKREPPVHPLPFLLVGLVLCTLSFMTRYYLLYPHD